MGKKLRKEGIDMSTARTYAGVRDWFGVEASRRRYIVDKVVEVFRSFGYEELETPLLELRETLLGKGGQEANESVYLFRKGGSEIGLRFDQTVPLARVAAQFSNELTFPYRRFTAGPVFRADKPQAGRYRQFTQLDFDVLGVDSAAADAEVIAVFYGVATALGFTGFRIEFNDRALLTGMAQSIGAETEDQIKTVLRAWDNMAKKGLEQMAVEVVDSGLDGPRFLALTKTLTDLTGDNRAILTKLRKLFTDEKSLEGIGRLEQILNLISAMSVPEDYVLLSPTLARGLDYYTGPIFEVVVDGVSGSLAGGGRYANLIEQLGGPSITGTGASFGLERVYSVMEQQGLLPTDLGQLDAFVTVFSPDLMVKSYQIATLLRQAGFSVEVDQTGDKLGKQFRLADARQARFVLVIGPDEQKSDTISIKRLRLAAGGDRSNQETVPGKDLVDTLVRWTKE
jgi:histidyl-tRNA synthetase